MTTMTIGALPKLVERAEIGLPARLTLSLAGGGLLAAGFALHPLWWAPWIAPLPLIAAAGRKSAHAWTAGAIAGVAIVAGLAPYYVEIMGVGGTLTVLLLRMLMMGAALRATQFALTRLPLPLAAAAMPAFFAAVEQVQLTASVHGASGSLAYSQMDMPQLIQVASLGGVPAVVFMILLPGSILGSLATRRWPAGERVAALGSAAILALALTLYSTVRLAPAKATLPTTLVSTDRFEFIPKGWAKVWAVYGPVVREGATRGGLVVLPEKIALLDAAGAQLAASDAAAAAKATGATIVVGVEVKDRVYRNRALVASPDGRTLWYDKQRLVPGFEDRDVAGKRPLLVQSGGARLGVAICKDMHIPSIGHEYAGQTGVMAIPAWDFGRDGWMGARQSAMRGVENGYAMVRASRNGKVGAYDSAGRVIAETSTAKGVVTLKTFVPVELRPTLYARIGNVFGWACVAAMALLASAAGYRRFRMG